MKKLLIISISLLFVMFCSKSPKTMGWYEGSYDNVLSSAGDKLIMVEFFTDT
ncbi:MAG: hypothetical protein ACE5D7_07105 [Fidelibacterota bacterium]